MKKVVVIGGGTGVFTVLSGLKVYPYKLSAIVSMADDGGSTGALREEFGILPPGDIRRALIALSSVDNKILSELFNFRFEEGSSLKGHSLGNLLITALERITGNFRDAVYEATKILNVKGEVVPVTLTPTRLAAELENGEIIKGETNIDIPKHDGKLHIKKLYLKPEVSANPDAISTIEHADTIILGPGDLYTSIIPNLLVKGIVPAIKASKAKKIYVVNIMTKLGETYGFCASDFLTTLEHYLGKNIIDYCVINIQHPKPDLLLKYQREKYDFVKFDKNNFKNGNVKVVTGSFLRRGTFLRHDPKKLADSLSKIINKRNINLLKTSTKWIQNSRFIKS